MITIMKRMPLGRFSWVVLVDVAIAVTIGRSSKGTKSLPRGFSRIRALSTMQEPGSTMASVTGAESESSPQAERPFVRRGSIPKAEPKNHALITRRGVRIPTTTSPQDGIDESAARQRKIGRGKGDTCTKTNETFRHHLMSGSTENRLGKINDVVSEAYFVLFSEKLKFFSQELKNLVDFEKVKADSKLSQHAFQRWDDFVRYLMTAEDVFPSNPWVSPVQNWLKKSGQSHREDNVSNEAASGVSTFEERITTQSISLRSRELVKRLRKTYSEYIKALRESQPRRSRRSRSRSGPTTSNDGVSRRSY